MYDTARSRGIFSPSINCPNACALFCQSRPSQPPLATLFWPRLYPLFAKTIVTHPGCGSPRKLQVQRLSGHELRCKCRRVPGILILMRQRARKRGRECGARARKKGAALSSLAGSSFPFSVSLSLSLFLPLLASDGAGRDSLLLCALHPPSALVLPPARARARAHACVCVRMRT